MEQQQRIEAFGVDVTPAPWPATPLERLAGGLWQQLARCRDQLEDAQRQLHTAARHEGRLLVQNVAAGLAIGLVAAGAIVGVDQLAELVR